MRKRILTKLHCLIIGHDWTYQVEGSLSKWRLDCQRCKETHWRSY